MSERGMYEPEKQIIFLFTFASPVKMGWSLTSMDGGVAARILKRRMEREPDRKEKDWTSRILVKRPETRLER